MGKVIYFEITADDVAGAGKFYKKAFGWEAEPSPFLKGYNLVQTGQGQGVDGAIMDRSYQAQPTIVWLEVDDIDETLRRVKEAGGEVVQDKNTIPGVGHMAYVTDPEGTVVGVKQPSA